MVHFETNLFFLVCFGNCSWKESIFWVLLLFLRPFSVCFSSFWNKSVCFGCFKIHPKHRNKPKQNFHWFQKWTETNAKQILFRLFSVRTEIFFYSFRGHPKLDWFQKLCWALYSIYQVKNHRVRSRYMTRKCYLYWWYLRTHAHTTYVYLPVHPSPFAEDYSTFLLPIQKTLWEDIYFDHRAPPPTRTTPPTLQKNHSKSHKRHSTSHKKYSTFNIICSPLKIAHLKETVLRDFLPAVFHQTASSGPIRDSQERLWFLANFHGVI